MNVLFVLCSVLVRPIGFNQSLWDRNKQRQLAVPQLIEMMSVQ